MQQGGIVDNSTNALYLGEQATGDGSYQIYGGELKTAGIGVGEWGGIGRFYQDGGVVSVTNELGVARQLNSTGTYELWGGELKENWGKVGIDGTGVFLHYGGRHTVTTDLNIGSGAGSGEYVMDFIPDDGDGNPVLNANVLRIGELGTGSFLQGVGTVNVGTILVIAENFGVQGSYRMQGGTLNTPALFVGDSGQGGFVQTGGLNNAGDLVLGVYGPNSGEPLSEGSYRLEGGELHTTAARIGNEGRGHFVQTGGTHSVVNEVILAHLPGSEGVYELQGGTLTASLVAINAGSTGSAGRLLYSGGTLIANVGNDGYTELSGEGTRTVTGDVYNAGTWKVTGTQAVYTGTFTNAGAYMSDPSVNSFVDLVITDTGYLVGGPGDQFLISGRFESTSTQNGLWDTQNAQLIFVGDADHDFWITGADLGASEAGYDHNFGWGDLQLEGEVLYLIDGNGTPGGALYVGTLSGLVIVDGDTIHNIHGNGLNIYYAPWANPSLEGKTYLLMDGGLLAPVPEPETWAMLLAGLGLVGWVASRRKKA